MSSSLSAAAACSVGASNAGAQNCVGDGDGRPPPTRSTTTPSSTFKLRPRSKSLHSAVYSTSADDISPMKPHWLPAHAISPHGPVFPSPSTSTGEFGSGGNDRPATASVTQPLTFASMFASGNKCKSPIKKQKVQDQQLRWQPSSPDSSISYTSEANQKGSPLVSASADAPFPTATIEFLSSPPNRHASSNSAGDCSSLPRGDGNAAAISGDTSPFTPKGRLMMQKLCINSLTPPLTSACPTPDKSNSNSGSSQLLLHHQTLPTMPTFSFSPSLKLDGNFICRNNNTNTTMADSSVRETIVFSGGSTPQGTPKRVGCPRASSTTTTASASSSPFHSLRGQMTPIGQQRGSVFKTLPPRLYPMGRDDTDSIGTSVNNETTTSSWACSSMNSASPSPRVVPLTVLSRNSNNASPAMSPKIPMMLFGPSATSSTSNNNYPPPEPSPLMLSNGRKVGDDTNEDFGTLTTNQYLPSPRSSDIEIPNITKALQSPLSTGSSSHRFLPRIKLTPRGTYNFAPISRDSGGRSQEDGSMTSSRRCNAASHTTATPSSADQASSSLIYSPGDKVAAEMDSLLNGFEHHKSSDHPDMAGAGSRTTTYHEHPKTITDDSLNRVESEEAEMVALTQGHPFQMSDCRLRPTTTLAAAAAAAAEEEESQTKCNHRNYGKKPMSSITLNLETSCHHQHHRDATTSSSTLHHHATSPSFLPRPMPMDQSKSRSLFDTSRNSYERILLADAIAEAARSNEPLTDDEDSDIDGDSDFLLCLPRDSRDNSGGNRSHSKSLTVYNTEKQCFVKPSNNLVRADSPSFFGCDSLATKTARNGTLSARRKSGDQCLPSHSSQTTLTIYEDCAAMPTSSSSKRLYEGLMMKHGASEATFATYCSLSDCDASEILSSPKYFKMKAALGVSKERHSVCSLLSMSSLCGLDIVHETSQSGCGEQEFSDQIIQSISTESHDFTANSFRPLPLTRSEFSMNSLGLSLDSMDAGVDSTRDLFTPPMVMSAQNCKRMLSPPPLRHRPNNSLYHNRS